MGKPRTNQRLHNNNKGNHNNNQRTTSAAPQVLSGFFVNPDLSTMQDSIAASFRQARQMQQPSQPEILPQNAGPIGRGYQVRYQQQRHSRSQGAPSFLEDQSLAGKKRHLPMKDEDLPPKKRKGSRGYEEEQYNVCNFGKIPSVEKVHNIVSIYHQRVSIEKAVFGEKRLSDPKGGEANPGKSSDTSPKRRE